MQQKHDLTQQKNNNAQLYGNKSSNLIILKSICPDSVPPFIPLSDSLIKDHLDRYAPKWRELYTTFQQIQGKERTMNK